MVNYPKTLWPTTCELVEHFNKPWAKLCKAEQEEVLAAWLKEDRETWQALCDFDELGMQVGKVILCELDKSDFVQNITDYLLRTQADFFAELAEKFCTKPKAYVRGTEAWNRQSQELRKAA
jgi:hypothetical protein